MVKNIFRWFEYVERIPIESVIRRVDKIKDNQINRGDDLEKL